MQIIGLSGYARTGKDTAAEVLVNEFGYTRVAFADKLREFCLAVNPLIPTDATMPGVHERLSALVEAYGWEKCKDGLPEVRALLQRTGVAARDLLGIDVWVNAAFDGLDPAGSYVFTDVRFPNEAVAIQWGKGNYGQVWRIERTGVSAVNAHISETALDGYPFDRTIWNAGSLEDFRDSVREAMACV